MTTEALNALFGTAWETTRRATSTPILSRSLLYVCAYDGKTLVGFVNVAWDGGIHAFLLDTTVHQGWQRQGIGGKLVRRAAEEARERGIMWLHVDYEPHLEAFYRGCGFSPTAAGLIRLNT